MKKLGRFVPSCLVAFAIAGCSDPARAEKTFSKTVDLVNEMSDILEKSNNVAQAKPKLESVIERLKAVRAEGSRIVVSKSQMAEIQGQFLEKFKEAKQRLDRAERQMLIRDPVGTDALDDVMDRFDDLMNLK